MKSNKLCSFLICYQILCSFGNCVQDYGFIDKIIGKNIVFCSKTYNDFFQEKVLENSGTGNIWIKNWNCLEHDLPFLRDGVMILDEIEPQDLHRIFTMSGIQNSLSSNLWLILSQSTQNPISKYFDQTNLRLGLNAQILFLDLSNKQRNVIQVLGAGTYKVEFKVHIEEKQSFQNQTTG